jgi:hypothetical protein
MGSKDLYPARLCFVIVDVLGILWTPGFRFDVCVLFPQQGFAEGYGDNVGEFRDGKWFLQEKGFAHL